MPQAAGDDGAILKEKSVQSSLKDSHPRLLLYILTAEDTGSLAVPVERNYGCSGVLSGKL